MKILVISNYYPPHYIGGYEIACQQTVNYLRQQGHSVKVLTSHWKARTSPLEDGVSRSLALINQSQPRRLEETRVALENFRHTQARLKAFQPNLVYLWSQKTRQLSQTRKPPQTGPANPAHRCRTGTH